MARPPTTVGLSMSEPVSGCSPTLDGVYVGCPGPPPQQNFWAQKLHQVDLKETASRDGTLYATRAKYDAHWVDTVHLPTTMTVGHRPLPRVVSDVNLHHHACLDPRRTGSETIITKTTTVNRAKREAELVQRGASASEAALKADKELAEKEESQHEELIARLAADK